MQKIRITNHQLFSLTTCTSIGGTIIIVPAVMAGIAKQDAWIAAIIAPVYGIFQIWVYTFWGSRYPGMTFIGVIRSVLGKWVGFIVAASYVYFCLTLSYHIPWYIGNFMNTQAMPNTPPFIINLLFMAVCIIALLYGLETFARASELFVYFITAIFLLAMLLDMPNVKPENLQPVLEKGIIPILKSSWLLSAFISFHLFVTNMIFPINVTDVSQAKKAILKGYLWSAFIVFIVILMSILVLGSAITAKTQYPTYLLIKEINVGTIITRIEFVITAMWLITQSVVEIVVLYAGLTGLSELLGLKDHKVLILPMGLVISVMTTIVFPDVVYQANWISLVWVPYITVQGAILPILLVLVYYIKKWFF